MDKDKAVQTKDALLEKLKALNAVNGDPANAAMGEMVIDALDLLFSIAIAGAFK